MTSARGLLLQRLHQRAVFEAARNRQIVLRRVEQLVEEILGVRGVKFLRLGVGLGDADELQEAEAIRIVVAALARRAVPIAVGHRLGVLGAEIAQMTEAVVVLDDIFGGRGNAGARNPDRRMRLLDRPRPQVDHAELIMLAVPGENLPRRPRLDDQRQRLAEALALLDRHDAVEIVASVGSPVGNPATSRPPLMQSSMAYSSAMRVGGVVDGKVEPSWMMAMFWPLVAFASTAPMRLGLAMKP